MKNTVLRKCRGCKTLKDREDMVKVTVKDGDLFINPDSRITGRSVYVCRKKECLNVLIKSKGIKKGLKFNNDEKIREVENVLLKIISSD
ncbi:MAG: YlxR family protein [bacterium]|nr:YlxR family protein [bacterium]